ncbi:hypothetical protein [Gordonia sp. (in: high G+C Gram-positive bacteria)]|uniref:hypothetical protein n=1 Tax=Gordonia sp. (in: high G+C Gram-positive bacteria) TaxID=84139 RepID=UPI0039E60A26
MTAPVPQPPEKPALASPVAIATELWLVVIAAMAVAQIGSYDKVRDLMVERRDKLPKNASESLRQSADMMTSTGLIIASLVVSVLVGAALALTVMYFLRAGHNWARLLLSGLSAYVVVGAVLAFAGQRTWTQVPEIIAAGCAGGALLLLMRRDSDTYCRDMAQYRAAAKAQLAPPPGAWQQQPWQVPPPPPQNPGGGA